MLKLMDKKIYTILRSKMLFVVYGLSNKCLVPIMIYTHALCSSGDSGETVLGRRLTSAPAARVHDKVPFSRMLVQ